MWGASGPILNLYVTLLADVVRSFGIQVLSYTDDTLIVSISNDLSLVAGRFNQCMSSIICCMQDNSLKINTDKTEVLVWFSKLHLVKHLVAVSL